MRRYAGRPRTPTVAAEQKLARGVLLGAVTLAAISLLTAIQVRRSDAEAPDAAERDRRTAPTRDEEADFRLREGNELKDTVGEFQVAGERIRFRPLDRTIKMTVLENLALERVSRVLDETRTPPLWSVSGTITEFHGGNFLLITRAVIKSKPSDD